MTPAICPVILCGGSGTRLWPLSRARFPKQFAKLTGERSLFQQCAERLAGDLFAPPLIVTAAAFRFVVLEQLQQIGVEPAGVLIEPEPRDTAPAVLAAAIQAASTDADAVVLIAPSDHLIPDPAPFLDAVVAGLAAVACGDIVTFGVTPDRAETGYGYLEVAEPAMVGAGAAPRSDPVRRLARYVEKPDPAGARTMAASGAHLWNAGIFLAAARDLLAAFEAHAPDLVEPVRAAVLGARSDLGFRRLDPASWAGVRAVSVDYAVMERASNLSVVPLGSGWSDLGDWEAVWRTSDASESGVVRSGSAHALDCSNSLLHARGEGLELVGIGLKDMLVVAMPDAVLVAPRERAQDVRQAVERLKAQARPQATEFARDYRPWGWFECVARGERHQVKRIVVRPGGVLSLQSHLHRAEHWIVVSGTARVRIGEEVRLLSENESIYVPLGAMHRLENPGKMDLHVIEVQTGAYLGEDDITRYEDAYSRSANE